MSRDQRKDNSHRYPIKFIDGQLDGEMGSLHRDLPQPDAIECGGGVYRRLDDTSLYVWRDTPKEK